jgi:hypothetical protein
VRGRSEAPFSTRRFPCRQQYFLIHRSELRRSPSLLLNLDAVQAMADAIGRRDGVMWVVRGVLADGQLVSISFTDRSGIEAIPSMVSEATTAIDSSPGHVSLAQLVQQDLLGPPWPGANPGADLIQRWAGEAVEAFATAQDGSFLQSTVKWWPCHPSRWQ